MFAEDVSLIPAASFTSLLESLRARRQLPAAGAVPVETMRERRFLPVLRQKLLRFNGGLFEHARPSRQRGAAGLAGRAGKADWRTSEPAILAPSWSAPSTRRSGTPGAHYTPRDYVERLVLRLWSSPAGRVESHPGRFRFRAPSRGQGRVHPMVKGFHDRLCQVRILDPACAAATSSTSLSSTSSAWRGRCSTPWRLREHANHARPRRRHRGPAPACWAWRSTPRRSHHRHGALDWLPPVALPHPRRGHAAEPVVKKFHNIECRDAVLACDGTERSWTTTAGRSRAGTAGPPDPPGDGGAGARRNRTGASAALTSTPPGQVAKADFVVATRRFSELPPCVAPLGDGYVEALRKAWQDVPDSADYVMFWWQQAADLTRKGKLRRLASSPQQPRQRQPRVLQTQSVAKRCPVPGFAIPTTRGLDAADRCAQRAQLALSCQVGRLLPPEHE